MSKHYYKFQSTHSLHLQCKIGLVTNVITCCNLIKMPKKGYYWVLINFTLPFSGGRLFGTRDASPLLLAPGVRLGKRFVSPSHCSQVHGVRHPAHDVVRLSENISGYVAYVCLTQLDSSVKLTVPAKICQTTSEHLHTNCTFTANLSTHPKLIHQR